jgi:hypothetical protein
LPILLNAAVIAVGIFANLAFEEASLDLVAFGVVAAVANVLLWLTGRRWTQLPFTVRSGLFGAGIGRHRPVQAVLLADQYRQPGDAPARHQRAVPN